MLPLSAIDAIGPAWAHTRRLLWDNRSWKTLLKIGAIASFAEVGASFRSGFNNGSLNNILNSNNSGTTGTSPFPGGHSITPGMIAAVASVVLVIVAVGFLISLIFFYIDSRLQFVLFEVVLRSDTTVGPIWRRYGAATWRWMGLKFMFFLICLLLCLPLLIPIVLQFVHIVGDHSSASQHPAALLVSMFAVFGVIGLIVLIFSLFFVFIYDFGLPSMALESTSISETVRRVWNMLRAEPGQCFLYLVMRIIMGIAGSIASSVVLGIGIFILCIPLVIVGVLDFYLLHNSGGAGLAIMIVVFAILGLIFFAAIFIGSFMTVGYVLTFIQAYALYFLAGRYPLMGQYLAPYWPQSHRIIPVPPAYPPPSPAPPAFEPPAAI